jgi:endonuclease-3 related protein
LLRLLGPRGWWPTTRRPGQPPVYRLGREGEPVSDRAAFEIMVGAVLTQNTAWRNVEKALVNLTAAPPKSALRGAGGTAWPPAAARRLDVKSLATAGPWLEEAIRPSGYFRQKAARLRLLAAATISAGGVKGLRRIPTPDLREILLSWHGIGPETADSILCYAFARPVFVVDAYTRRLFASRGLPHGSYDEIQELVHAALPSSVAPPKSAILGAGGTAWPPAAARFNDLHARIVHYFSCHLKRSA